MMKENRNEQQFVECVERHRNIIYKVCLMYATDNDHLKDLFQDVVLNMWNSYARFRGECKETTWIYRVALNTCITHIRKHSRQVRTMPLTSCTETLRDEDDAHVQMIRQMYGLISKLENNERAIILLWLEDKSYEEMAEVLGISKSNVGVKLNRIREKLKKMSND